LRKLAPDLDDEKQASFQAVRSSVEKIRADVLALQSSEKLSAEDFSAVHRQLETRISATQTGLQDLREAGVTVDVELEALTLAAANLERPVEGRQVRPTTVKLEKTVGAARLSFQDYLHGWLEGLIREVGKIATPETKSPADVNAAPMVLIDCTGSSSWSALSKVVQG